MPWPLSHYYGDKVRQLFIAGAIIMAVFLPFFGHEIPSVASVSIVAILVLGVAAGLTSPKRRLTSLLDVLISLGAVVVFERVALEVYNLAGLNLFFVINQALAIIFLVALYYATKTMRGMGKQS